MIEVLKELEADLSDYPDLRMIIDARLMSKDKLIAKWRLESPTIMDLLKLAWNRIKTWWVSKRAKK